MIQAILFDKDGTLFDIDATWSTYMNEFVMVTLELLEVDVAHTAQLLSDVGIIDGKIIMNSPFATQPAQVTVGQLIQAVIKLNNSLTMNRVEQAMKRATKRCGGVKAVAMPGLADVITHCQRKGYLLGIATMDGEMETLQQLSDHGLLESFHFVATSDNCDFLKPDAKLVELFSTKIGVPIANIAIVGDSENDMQLGINAGTQHLYYLSQEKHPHRDVRIIQTLEALCEYM